MSVKLRLQRKGRTKAPFYHIVVADARSPRDGRFIEKVGTYNPLTVPATIELNRERAFAWLMNGAQPTDTVRAILRFKGVMFQKHLDRGVKKGALTTEQAAEQLSAWIEQKETGITARREATVEKRRQHIVAVDGKPKAKPKPVEAPAPVMDDAPMAEETTPVMETAAPMVEETAPVMEEAAPMAEEAAPVMEETAPEVADVTADAAMDTAEEAPAVEADAPADEMAAEEAPAADTDEAAENNKETPA